MISLGLTAAQQAEFHAALVTSHSVDVTVRLLTLDRVYVADLSDQLIDGQVNIDSDADVTRNLTLSLRDPARTLSFDTSAPTDGALFADRMLTVVYTVSTPAGKRWSVPIFAGPITSFSRQRDVISVEAKGKESLIIPPTVAWFSKSYAKGIVKTTLVRSILSTYGGETLFTFANFPERTAAPVTLAYNSNIWAVAKGVVGSRAYRHLFYDGRGVCVLRETPDRAAFAFKTGDGGSIVTDPVVSFNVDDVRNASRVTGQTPTGAKTPVVGISSAPRAHPLSTYNLGRNGQQRIILDEFQDDHAKTAAQAKATAQSRLSRLLLEAVTVNFEALVIPHLEPEDIFTVTTPDLSLSARVKQLSIPLHQGTMTVGYNAKRSVNAARIRRRK